MKKRRVSSIRLLAHERLVIVEYAKGVKIEGYAFGSDRSGNIFVCLAKKEMEASGLTCNGPCINKAFSTTKVTFEEGGQHVVEVNEEQEVEE